MADDFNSQYGKPLYGVGGNWASTGFGGSPQTPVPDIPGTTETTAWVTPYSSGYQNGDAVAVSPDSVNLPAQTGLYGGHELISGVDHIGTTGLGNGSAGHSHGVSRP